MVFKYAFGLFISLHHDFFGSSFSHGGECFLAQRVFLSRIEGISFSHRTHRFNRIFPPAFRVHRTPPAYRYHRTLLLFSIIIRDNAKPTSFL